MLAVLTMLALLAMLSLLAMFAMLPMLAMRPIAWISYQQMQVFSFRPGNTIDQHAHVLVDEHDPTDAGIEREEMVRQRQPSCDRLHRR